MTDLHVPANPTIFERLPCLKHRTRRSIARWIEVRVPWESATSRVFLFRCRARMTTGKACRHMYWISKSIHWLNRLKRRGLILLAVLGPGIITMVADNDAGGISTYAQTGAKTGFSLLWAFIILVPMAYYVQEMTVRLGAVTKRGHAEAIFDGFGPFWGWFSIFDLALINWLTLVTEYIGMTQAMRIFSIPEWITFLGVTLLMFGIVMSGRYWTFEKITLFFCLFNLVYIPAAIWAMQTGNVADGWAAVGRGFYRPQFQLARRLHARPC